MTVEEKSNYRKLVVWQKSMVLADQVIGLIETLDTSRKHYRLYEQLEAAIS